MNYREVHLEKEMLGTVYTKNNERNEAEENIHIK